MTKEEFEKLIADETRKIAANLEALGFKKAIAERTAAQILIKKTLAASSYDDIEVIKAASFLCREMNSVDDEKSGQHLAILIDLVSGKVGKRSFEDLEEKTKEIISLEIQEMSDDEEQSFAYALYSTMLAYEPFQDRDIPQKFLDDYAYWQAIVPGRENKRGKSGLSEGPAAE